MRAKRIYEFKKTGDIRSGLNIGFDIDYFYKKIEEFLFEIEAIHMEEKFSSVSNGKNFVWMFYFNFNFSYKQMFIINLWDPPDEKERCGIYYKTRKEDQFKGPFKSLSSFFKEFSKELRDYLNFQISSTKETLKIMEDAKKNIPYLNETS